MAIILKTAEQIRLMKEAGRITGEAILKARDVIRPGVSTWEVDRVIHDYIVKCGAKPSFLGYAGFPGSACVSVNSEVIHGIPSRTRILEEGDLVKVDVGALYRGYHGDSAKTFAVGRVSAEATALMERTKECFYRGVAKAVAGNRIGDVDGSVLEDMALAHGRCAPAKRKGKKYTRKNSCNSFHLDAIIAFCLAKAQRKAICII